MKLNVSRIMVLLMVILFALSGALLANAQKAKQYLDYGNKYLKAKQYDKAIQYLNYSVKMQKTSNAYFALGLAYYYKKNKAQSLRNFQMALKLNPGNSKAKSMVAKLGGGGGAAGGKEKQYLIQGHKYLKAKRYDAAIKYYNASARVKPTYQAYQFMGTAYFYKGDKANARAAYQKSLQINPNNPGVRRMLSKLGGAGGGEARLGEQVGVHPLLLAGLFAGALGLLFAF